MKLHAGGLVGYVVGAVVMVTIALFIINRVSFLRTLIAGPQASA